MGCSQSSIVLQHFNLIDGVSGQPVRDATVVVQRGRIASVTRNTAHAGSDAVVIDLSECWSMPGLIDAHVHFSDLKSARALVAGGVTTAWVLQVAHFIDVGVRELDRRGMADLPDEISCVPVRIRLPAKRVVKETFSCARKFSWRSCFCS
jgi:adenine deaminase